METKLPDRNILARIDAAARDRLSPAHTALYWWGLLNIYLCLAQQFLNYIANPLGLNKLTYASMVLWVLIAIWVKKAPLRIPLSIGLVILLAVWFNICTVHAEATIARMTIFTAMDILLYVYAIAFMQAACLVWFAPEVRRIIGRTIVGICVLSSFVSFVQFLNFGPAIEYANLVRGNIEIVFIASGSAEESIRSPGLFSNIGTAAVYGALISVVITTALEYRKLRWYEYVSVGMLALSTVLVQVRTILPLIAICFLYIAVRVIKTQGRAGILGVSLAFLGVVGFFILRIENFSYITGAGGATMDFRQDVLWTQAWQIAEERFWTGIGIEPAFAGWTTQVLPNKWVQITLIDSGYLIALCFGGFPGMLLLILTCVASLTGSLRLLRAPDEDGWHRAFKLLTFWLVLFFSLALYWGTQWVNPAICAVYFILAGLSMPSIRSDLSDSKVTDVERRALAEAPAIPKLSRY